MDMNYKKVLNKLQNLKCYHKGKIKAFSIYLLSFLLFLDIRILHSPP